MTLRDLIDAAGQRPLLLLILFVALPVAAWVTGRLHRPGRGGETPWRYVYAVLVYFACVPGISAAVVAAYLLFFTRESLLDVNLLVFLLPVASMIATLVTMRRSTDFDDVPGFDRLAGLMVMIGVSFAIALGVQKTRLWVMFGAPIVSLLGIAVVAFLLLTWASKRAFGRRL